MTFGTLKKEGNTWLLKAEPHVAMRAKRLFPRAKQSRIGTITLQATDEVARDLEWLMERFPLDVTEAGDLFESATRHKEQETYITNLMAGKCQMEDFELALPPREYQKVAASLALRTGGLLIADQMGLGKTCSAICVMIKAQTRPALVATLTHLPKQWEEEIQKFAPGLSTHRIKGTKPYDLAKDGVLPDVLITTYSRLDGWRDVLAGTVNCVVFDEVQEIRHPDSKKSKAAAAIAYQAAYRIGCSGTPIHNYGEEFYNILNVIRPDVLGSRSEFLREWCGRNYSMGKASIMDPKAFGAYLRTEGLMLRRNRSDVARELPSLTRVTVPCETNVKALKDAESAAAELAKIILAQDSSWSDRGQAAREIDWRMRQATGIAKATYIAAFVRMLVDSGEKVLLLGWHRQVYDIWADSLSDLNPVFFTGTESANQKDKAKTAFIEGDAQVLVMSLRSGVGLDGLQEVCSVVVFGELDWSDSVHEQDIARIHRDGQKDKVIAYFPISESGSDPIVAEVCGIKKAQLHGVRDLGEQEDGVFSSRDQDGIRKLAERYAKHPPLKEI